MCPKRRVGHFGLCSGCNLKATGEEEALSTTSYEIVDARSLVQNGVGNITETNMQPHGEREPLRLYTLEDGTVLGRPGILLLDSRTNRLVLQESVSYADRIQQVADQALSGWSTSNTDDLSLGSACLFDCHWADNIWHWFTEWVPRAAALEAAGFEGTYLIPHGAVYAGSLELLGIPAERLLVRPTAIIHVQRLSFTQCLNGHMLGRWPWLLRSVRERIIPRLPAGESPRYLYIGRRGDKRRVLNEPDVLSRLAADGFAVVFMEDYPIEEQVRLARDAEVIVGPHGAGMVFSMFMKPGGTIIEMFHARYINPCMSAICNLLELDYRMLVSSVNPPDNFRSDDLIQVDLPLLDIAIRNVLPSRETTPSKFGIDDTGDRATATTEDEYTMNLHLEHFHSSIVSLCGNDCFSGFPLDSIPIDVQGFQSPENAPFFDVIFARLRPRSLVELGSWKGTSAIMFAQRMLLYCRAPIIACVDTWTGSLEHWLDAKWRTELNLQWGHPTLYQRFAANVIRADVAKFIKPLPMTTGTALRLLHMMNVKVDAIYVDASNEYRDVLSDLEGAWELLAPSGFIVVDDFYAPDVQRAVCEFTRRSGVLAIYNADAPWPETLITRNEQVYDAIVTSYSGLASVVPIQPRTAAEKGEF
jgi:predicted O-methyltransferase YrrM